LVKIQGDLVCQTSADNLGSFNDGPDEQSYKENKQDEVENGVSPDTSLAQLGLLHRINWRSDLTTRTKPEEHHRVCFVDLGNCDDWQHHEKKNVAKDEVTSEHSKFGDLAKEFSSRLRY